MSSVNVQTRSSTSGVLALEIMVGLGVAFYYLFDQFDAAQYSTGSEAWDYFIVLIAYGASAFGIVFLFIWVPIVFWIFNLAVSVGAAYGTHWMFREEPDVAIIMAIVAFAIVFGLNWTSFNDAQIEAKARKLTVLRN